MYRSQLTQRSKVRLLTKGCGNVACIICDRNKYVNFDNLTKEFDHQVCPPPNIYLVIAKYCVQVITQSKVQMTHVENRQILRIRLFT